MPALTSLIMSSRPIHPGPIESHEHPLIEYYQLAMQTNEIFLVVAKVILSAHIYPQKTTMFVFILCLI